MLINNFTDNNAVGSSVSIHITFTSSFSRLFKRQQKTYQDASFSREFRGEGERRSREIHGTQTDRHKLVVVVLEVKYLIKLMGSSLKYVTRISHNFLVSKNLKLDIKFIDLWKCRRNLCETPRKFPFWFMGLLRLIGELISMATSRHLLTHPPPC